MAASRAIDAALFALTRLPLFNAITLLMLLSEKESKAREGTPPPLDPTMIYGHIFLFVVVGVGMGYNIQKKQCAVVHAGQLIYLAYVIGSNTQLRYNQWLKVRICGRMIASGGVYLFYADLVSRSPSRQLRKLSETLIGIYLVCFAYALLNSKEDKAAFIRIVPMGEALLYILTAIIGFCCICFLSGKYIKDGALALAIVATLYTAVIDGNLPYWTKRKNLDYWVQIRLIQEHVCLVLGCVLYHLTFWKRLKQD